MNCVHSSYTEWYRSKTTHKTLFNIEFIFSSQYRINWFECKTSIWNLWSGLMEFRTCRKSMDIMIKKNLRFAIISLDGGAGSRDHVVCSCF